ncbi:hypothetical protein RF11_07454 [Thelohanellus kitauei]|uniref:Uncharacterized protein n=1 Tax=Thelohanellus kitauei TaxID=669202 RepID=A0A0C2N0N6_THEKT|nr:hypothetical protein RF11_07454 [Thelohanellus kitauei]
MLALSDMEYIENLQQNKSIFMYENLKSLYLWVINEDFINDVFSTRQSQFLNEIQNKCSESALISEFETYTNVMEMILISFNESNYIEKRKAEYLMSLCEDFLKRLPEIQSDETHCGIYSDSMTVANTSYGTKLYMKNTLLGILRWFVLIYELKFIFGDINSEIRILDSDG